MLKELWILKYRKGVIAVTILIVMACVFPLLRTTVNSDLESYLPETMPSSINNRKIEAAQNAGIALTLKKKLK